jgi:putative two-component system response regulator
MRILIADDNLFYRRSLAVALRDWGYMVVEACDGEAAWEILRRPNAPRLAIIDWMMPGADGLEVCRRVRAMGAPEPTYIVMLTAREGKNNVVEALDAGADDYLTKPFDREELQARLRVGRRIVELQTTQTAVFTFARAVDAKSPYTRGHSDRVTHYALVLGDAVGIAGKDREILRTGGRLHDIGKMSVPDAILNKPGPLTPEEFALIKRHPVDGVKIVEPLQSLRDTLPIIRSHHERLDGKGYPDGLHGNQLSLLVRIVSVADVYDALASDRPYRAAIPHPRCLEMLGESAATGGLDINLVSCFKQIPLDALLAYSNSISNPNIDLGPALAIAAAGN